MIKAIIFDADNTLYKINKVSARAEQFHYLEKETGIKKERLIEVWERVKTDMKQSPNPDDRKREHSTGRALSILEVDPRIIDKISARSVEIFNENIAKDLAFDSENRKILQYLSGKYKLCIASDEFEKFLKMKLDKALIDYRRYFSFMITPEKTDSMKPSARYYEIALQRLKLNPDEVMMIGDSWERDLKIASEMGMKTILVSERIEGSPNHWINKLSELRKIL
jgi:2-haloacid dehalogenase